MTPPAETRRGSIESGTQGTDAPAHEPPRAASVADGRRAGDQADQADQAEQAQPQAPAPKRIRLSLACNQCRKRKVRCDAERPKCRNCWLRDEACETTDPRRPEAGPVVVRRWATQDGLFPGQNPAATHRNQALVPKHAGGPGPGAQDGRGGLVGARREDDGHNNPEGPDPPNPAAAAGSSHGHDRTSSTTPSEWGQSTRPDVNSSLSDGQGTSGRVDHDSNHQNTSGISRPSELRVRSWVSKAYQHAVQGQGDDPIHQTGDAHPDVVVNADEASEKVKYLGGSSLQCLTIFLDMHLRKRRLQTVAPCFKGGMRFVEEFDLPLNVPLPSLPAFSLVSNYVETFFNKIWPLIPVIDHDRFLAEFDRLHRGQNSHPEGLRKVIQSQDVPSVACIFAVLAMGADETAGAATDLGTVFIEAAYSLYAHLIASPYLSSVQALVLVGFALRGKSKDGQCWQLTGQAVRIAHSIGLHRHLSSLSRFPRLPRDKNSPSTLCAHKSLGPGQFSLEARVWWSCYALERLMELETGRPSALTEQEIDQVEVDVCRRPRRAGDEDEEPGCATGTLHLFVLWVSLARIMGQISEHLYRKRISSSWQLLHETGRLDQLLLEWVRAVPEGIKPGQELVQLAAPDARPRDAGATGPGRRDRPLHLHPHIAAFLSLQYYQAQITLFRASLTFPAQGFLDEIRVQNAVSPLPSYPRLLQSQSLSTAAARAMAHQVLEMADHCRDGVFPSRHIFAPTQPFLAAVVLGLNVLKSPAKRTVRSDVELLVGTTEYIESFYRRVGQSVEFVQGCARLRNSILEALAAEGQSTAPGGRHDQAPAVPAAGGTDGRTSVFATDTQPGEGYQAQAQAQAQAEAAGGASMNTHMSSMDPLGVSGEAAFYSESFEGLTFEQLWSSMSSDFLMGPPLDFTTGSIE